MLRPSQSSSLSPEPQPVESRIKQDKSDFEEQQRQRVAQEARAEKRQKKQVRTSRTDRCRSISASSATLALSLFNHTEKEMFKADTERTFCLVFGGGFLQERELVLKRIAEDRRSLQEKIQTSAAAETSPPNTQGQKLGGKVETNVDNNCILMVRL